MQAGEKIVTLVTGDRVVLQDGKVDAVLRAKGREHIRFTHQRQGSHSYVFPEDALEHVASGKVDRRLFDVAGLVEAGYDRRATLPVLVSGQTAGVQAARQLGGTELSAAQAPRTAESWQALTASNGKVWLDGMRKPSLDRSTAQIGAPAAWQAGYTGKGVKVAVLDTGVDANHPDLSGKQVGEKNFTEDPDNTDKVGHGTHVAATIASGDAKFRGVAPDAQILDGKVCIEYGCMESWILGGMTWAAEQGAAVVNLSLGGPDTPEVDPLEDAVNKLSAQHGTLFVIAAGNSGTFEPVSSPGSADAALTVGAIDRDDSLAFFSSRGPRVGDGAVKPDVTAPGVGIVAAKAGTTERFAASGTSMATPHAAGAAALLKQQHPTATGAQIKALLTASAKPNPANHAFEQGAGKVDLAKAIKQTVTTDPVSLGLGNQPWPHNDDVPVTKEVTYRNAGTTDVTLDLKLETSAPAGMFSLAQSKVTVPAGGTAKVSVTGDSRVGTTDGAFSASLVATSGDTSARTAVALNREVESYNVTVNAKDRAGKPTVNHSTILARLDGPGFVFVKPEADGSTVVRLPKGHYYADSFLFEGAGPDRKFDVESYTDVDVSRDVTLDFDASKAKPISITGEDATLKPVGGAIIQERFTGQFGMSSALFVPTFDTVRIAGFGPKLKPEEFSVSFLANFAAANGDRHVYAFRECCIAPTGFERKVKKAELAKVRTKIGPMLPERKGVYGIGAVFPNGGGATFLTEVTTPVVTTFVNTSDGIRWAKSFWQLKGDQFPPEVTQRGPVKTYRAGKTYDERTNFAVFGPTLPDGLNIARLGDDIGVSVPMHSDEENGYGNSYVFDSAFTKLFRDGKLIGEQPYPSNGFFEKVPAGLATFKVESEVVRSTSEVSTKVATSWTFKSDTVAGEQFKPVPLSVVRFEPKLSDTNSAPAGKTFRVPLRVEQAKGANNGRINRVTVEVSFDDGKTWQRVPVVGDTALVRHPGKAGFVSLRGKAVDSKGNSSEVTIVRAYKIG